MAQIFWLESYYSIAEKNVFNIDINVFLQQNLDLKNVSYFNKLFVLNFLKGKMFLKLWHFQLKNIPENILNLFCFLLGLIYCLNLKMKKLKFFPLWLQTLIIILSPKAKFNELKLGLWTAKNRFQLSTGLNLETLNAIISSGTDHDWAASQIRDEAQIL